MKKLAKGIAVALMMAFYALAMLFGLMSLGHAETVTPADNVSNQLMPLLCAGALLIAALAIGLWESITWLCTGRYANSQSLTKLIVATALVLFAIGMLAAAKAETYVITVSDYCNVREAADKDSADLGDLYAGELVEGIGYQSGWVQVAVDLEQADGWVREDLLTLADYPVGRYANSTGGRVHIRKTPDGDHAHWLDAGHTVDVIRWVSVDGSAWAYTANGYIKSDCLEVE